jgi:hypothetical protein
MKVALENRVKLTFIFIFTIPRQNFFYIFIIQKHLTFNKNRFFSPCLSTRVEELLEWGKREKSAKISFSEKLCFLSQAYFSRVFPSFSFTFRIFRVCFYTFFWGFLFVFNVQELSLLMVKYTIMLFRFISLLCFYSTRGCYSSVKLLYKNFSFYWPFKFLLHKSIFGM